MLSLFPGGCQARKDARETTGARSEQNALQLLSSPRVLSSWGGPVSGSRAKAHPTGLDGGPPELAGAHIDFRALHGIRAGKERPEIL